MAGWISTTAKFCKPVGERYSCIHLQFGSFWVGAADCVKLSGCNAANLCKAKQLLSPTADRIDYWNYLITDKAEIGGELIMAASTFERVRDIIVEQLGVDPNDVTMEANFRDDLEADSLDLVELIMQFEEEFGGDISDDQAQKIVTVGDAVKFLDN